MDGRSNARTARQFTTALVTGGAGFIGSRITRKLAQSGCRVVVVDNLYSGLPLPEQNAGVVPVLLDIRNAAGLLNTLQEQRPDVVIHLAAVHHIPTCERDPKLAYEVNMTGTQTLLDAMSEAGTENLIMASSGAVYAWAEGPLREHDTPTSAADVYAMTKLYNEAQVRVWTEAGTRTSRVVRLFNTIGMGDPNGHLIPDILGQLQHTDERAVIKLGNTAPRRDYVHVDDVANGFLAILNEMNEPGMEVFNLCSGRDLSVGELVSLVGRVTGHAITIESDPSRVRKVDRPTQLGDPSKLNSRTGWLPTRTVADAVSEIAAGQKQLRTHLREEHAHTAGT